MTSPAHQLRDLPDVDSLYFTMLNCNKRSITINTKTAGGTADLHPAAGAAAMSWSRTSVRARSTARASPGKRCTTSTRALIYASGKGFGPGPYEHCKAYETVAQSTGGAMSHDRLGGRPTDRHRRPDR